MGHKLIEQLLQKSEKAKEDSDFYYFNSLLYTGEALVKTIIFGMLSAIKEEDDKDRHRYRLEYELVRKNSPGDCSRILEDILTGPASQHLLHEARKEQTELTQINGAETWQYQSILQLNEALQVLNIQSERLPIKSGLTRWFRMFAELRNKTRGHGATQSFVAGQVATPLADSINIIYKNFYLFERSWVHLYRNLSGKYRVSSLGNSAKEFDFLRKEKDHIYDNGIYIWWGRPKHIPFILSDPELSDFFIANGSFGKEHYELLSYNTDNRQKGETAGYLSLPGTLPESETKAHKELVVRGNCFTNAPDLATGYIERQELEHKLFNLLIDDRRTVITLHGVGGIGKTSLTLCVLKKIYNENHYDGIIWFSARDIDLLPDRIKVKQVHPDVFSKDDIAKCYSKLISPEDDINDKKFNHKGFFENELNKSSTFKACLFVFDNFETIQNPIEMFEWIDNHIRSPNKILVTTRLRDFKGDYPLEVSGMTEIESKKLIDQTAIDLQIDKSLVSDKSQKIISLSQGHPYIIKILLGELATTQDITRALSIQDKALTALFERTYANLTPTAQYAFMMLASWDSKVPKIALEAVLTVSFKDEEETTDIDKAIASLCRYSLAQKIKTKDQHEFIELPFTARTFGKKKVKISHYESKITEDVKLLQMFGAIGQNNISLNLYKRLEEFMRNVSNRIDKGESFEKYESILNIVCQVYNPANLLLARFYMEQDTDSNLQKSQEKLELFLQENSNENNDAIKAWIMLSEIYKKMEDYIRYVHALIEMSKIETVYFWKISNGANEINRLLHSRQLDIEKVEKVKLIETLLDVLEKRKPEAKADDFSRMAWLALHTEQNTKAMQYVEHGLKLEPQNQHCLQLKDKLSI